MLTPQEKLAVQEFKDRTRARFPEEVLSFTLFGSRARGEGHKFSDVDVLVLTREDSRPLRNHILDIANDIFLEYEINVSPTTLGQERFQRIKDGERLLAKEIERDGVKL